VTRPSWFLIRQYFGTLAAPALISVVPSFWLYLQLNINKLF